MTSKCSCLVSQSVLHFRRRFTTSPKDHVFDLHSTLLESSRFGEQKSYEVVLSSDFSVGNAPNGGYLMNIAIAAGVSAGDSDGPVLAANGYYVMKAEEAITATILCNVLKSKANGPTTVEVVISQKKTVRCKFLVTIGSHKTEHTLENNCCITAPKLPQPGECKDATSVLRNLLGNDLKVAKQFDFKVANNSIFAQSVLKDVASHDGPAEYEGWLKFSHQRKMCPRALAFMLDALPPPIHIISPITSSLWVPTINYGVHIWNDDNTHSAHNSLSRLSEVWYPFRFKSPCVINGFVQTDGAIWSPCGTILLATSRQMARVFPPRPK